ncbi:MAG: hypothetical protein MJ100_08960 [Ruminococcus sp.]|nr:hypothetical protein [Ruminococcus sp.]
MYEELIRRYKRKTIEAFVLWGILALDNFCMMIYGFINEEDYSFLLLAVALFAFLFYIYFKEYKDINKNIKLLQDALNIQSDAEFNELLEQSTRLEEFIFLNRTHLIVINKFLSFELKKINLLQKSFNSGKHKRTYLISVSDGNGIKKIRFPNERRRNEDFIAIQNAIRNSV